MWAVFIDCCLLLNSHGGIAFVVDVITYACFCDEVAEMFVLISQESQYVMVPQMLTGMYRCYRYIFSFRFCVICSLIIIPKSCL